MAHVEPCGPVTVENKSLAKMMDVPLVEFVKHSHIIVQLNGENVTLAWDADGNDYIVRHNGYDYEADGPRYRAVHD